MTGTDEQSPADAYREARENADTDGDVPSHGVEATEVFNGTLPDRLKAAVGFEIDQELAACGDVLAEIGDEHGVPGEITEFVEKHAQTVAQQTGNKVGGDEIAAVALPPIREVVQEHDRKTVADLADDPDHEYTVDHDDAIGIDEYVEGFLETVYRTDTTDYDTDPEYRFEFADGAVVEFEDNDHRHYAEFREIVAVAANHRVLNEVASQQALHDIQSDSNMDAGEEMYRELSHGPEDRPWGCPADDVDWWNEVITSLEEQAEPDISRGPNTSAKEDLKESIQSAQAARDLQSVVSFGAGAVHYNESKDEIWVPNQMIDAAWEDYATSRKSFRLELVHRGMVSDELPGKKAVEAVGTTNPSQRFWRLDATHHDVPVPVPVKDELESAGQSFGEAAGYVESASGGGPAAADGGEPADDDADDAREGGDA